MTKKYFLKEGVSITKLPAIYSDVIKNNIESIKEYNYFEKEGLSKLDSHIKRVEGHITNRSIAFDYGNNFTIESDGTIFIDYLGVRFRIEDDSKRVFVRITWIDLKLEEFGLGVPPNLQESKQHSTPVKGIIHLKKSELRRMINESVRMVLKEQRKQRLDEVISRSLHMVLNKHFAKIND